MFKLLELFFASRRAQAEPAAPQPCRECAKPVPGDQMRRHIVGHKARTICVRPLAIELRVWEHEKDLGPALAELRDRWPGRKFQLIAGTFAGGSEGGGLKARTILAIEDDWTIPHDPFGPY